MLAQLLFWDEALFQAVNGFAGDWTLDRIVYFTQSDYLLRCIPFVAPLWYFWFQPGNRQNERRDAVICLIFGVVVALVVNRTLASSLPLRVRPMYAEGIDFHPMSLASSPDMVGWSSFPSDNATFYFAVAIGIYFMSRALGAYLVIHAILFVCLPRVYQGIHYPGDIIVGAAIGVVVMIPIMTMPLARRLFFCQYIRKWAGMHSGLFAVLLFLASFEMVVLYDDFRVVLIRVAHFLHANGMIAREEGIIFILGAACLAVVVSGGAVYSRLWRKSGGRARRAAATR